MTAAALGTFLPQVVFSPAAVSTALTRYLPTHPGIYWYRFTLAINT